MRVNFQYGLLLLIIKWRLNLPFIAGQLDKASLEHPPQFSDNPSRLARFLDGNTIQDPDEPISVDGDDYCTYLLYSDKNDNSQG